MNPKPEWQLALERAQERFVAIAAADNRVRWTEEYAFALDIFARSSALQKAVPNSITGAMLRVAAIGVSLHPDRKLAFIVPRQPSKGAGITIAAFDLSYRGLVALAVDAGAIKVAQAEPVYDCEEATYRGHYQPPLHTYVRPLPKGAKIVAAYCHAILPDGTDVVEWMDRIDIEQARACATTQAVWSKWEGEQTKKTVVKRAAKMWPQGNSRRIAQGVAAMNEAEGISDEPPEPKITVAQANEIKQYLLNNFQNPKQVALRMLDCYEVTLVTHLPARVFNECMERLRALKATIEQQEKQRRA